MPDDSPRSMSEVPPVYAEQRTAAMLLASLEDGQFNQDITDALRDLVATLQDSETARGGKPKGSLNITIELKLDDGIVEVRSDFKVKKPSVTRRKSIMWATPNNNLTPDNPRQSSLPFRDVGRAAPRTIREDIVDDRAAARSV